MWPTVLAVLMLVCSNLIMTYAWFGHLRDNPDTFWFKVVLFSWSLAFFEYTLMIPAVSAQDCPGGDLPYRVHPVFSIFPQGKL